MKDPRLKYEKAKKKANSFMQKGQISAYIQALTEMNTCKNKMAVILSN